jgi:hypothetical protein
MLRWGRWGSTLGFTLGLLLVVAGCASESGRDRGNGSSLPPTLETPTPATLYRDANLGVVLGIDPGWSKQARGRWMTRIRQTPVLITLGTTTLPGGLSLREANTSAMASLRLQVEGFDWRGAQLKVGNQSQQVMMASYRVTQQGRTLLGRSYTVLADDQALTASFVTSPRFLRAAQAKLEPYLLTLQPDSLVEER